MLHIELLFLALLTEQLFTGASFGFLLAMMEMLD
jgi:hypothetical protein